MNSTRSIRQIMLVSLILMGCQPRAMVPPRPTPIMAFDATWAGSQLCAPPCWEHLTPGTTTYGEAIALIQNSLRIERIPAAEIAHIQPFGTPNAGELLIRMRDSHGLGGDLLFDYDGQGQPRQLYEIDLYPTPPATLADVIGWFGAPSAYTFIPVSFDAPGSVYLTLSYDSYQMKLMTPPIQLSSQQWDVRWSQPIQQLKYLSTRSYDSIGGRCAWPATMTLDATCA